MQIPYRPRRLRRTPVIRELAAETVLDPRQMIQPYFVTDGEKVREEIKGLPGIQRESVDRLVETVGADFKLGINKIMLFGVTEHKDGKASYAYDQKNPVIRAVNQLKDKYGNDLFIAADVCLCAYTDTGHCGLVKSGRVDNDASLEVLARMALELAGVGIDCVAPSDMMDARVGAIRDTLEDADHSDTIIMAYTAKYASSYYGPFREAAKSAPGEGDRKSYQMDFRNKSEALKELALDEGEGADIVMVKPALAYLDIIAGFAAHTDLPIAAYNVSGEYAAVKLLVADGQAEEKDLVIENLTAIARAGASITLTYHLRDIMKHGWLG